MTPMASLVDASNKVEEAHEGLGNIIHNNYAKFGEDCGDTCQAAIADAQNKTANAWHELRWDILGIHTWDDGRTVNHAFDAAGYWFGQLNQHFDDPQYAYHAEYQLGILRDVLRAQVKARQHPALRGELTLVGGTPKDKITDAYHKVFEAHEGIANVMHNNPDKCGEKCQAGIADALRKTMAAHDELGSDILGQTTWDHGQTVEHAFQAAEYWIKQLDTSIETEWEHYALTQLGILRDVLAANQ